MTSTPLTDKERTAAANRRALLASNPFINVLTDDMLADLTERLDRVGVVYDRTGSAPGTQFDGERLEFVLAVSAARFVLDAVAFSLPCTCATFPHFEGPAADCERHGNPAAAYRLGTEHARRDIRAALVAGATITEALATPDGA